MIILIDLLCILVVGVSILNFRIGYLVVICCKICIPSVARLIWGPISVNIFDIFILSLLFSFVYNKEYKKVLIPYKLRNLFLIYIVSSYILILFSSEYVPYSYQITSLTKNFLFQQQILILMGFFAFKKVNLNTIKILLITAIICGVYGIITYIIKANPLDDVFSVLYTGENARFSYFMEENRGSLQGRVFGTFSHPLAWGQFWLIVLAFAFLIKERIHNILFILVFFVAFANIFLSGSRSAMVGLILLFLFFLVSIGFRKTRYLLTMLLFMFIGLSFFSTKLEEQQFRKNNSYLLASIFFWDEKYSANADIRGSSVSMRQKQLNSAYKMISSSPLAGVGYDYQMYRYTKSYYNDELYGIEGVILKKLVEQGFVGLIVFFYFLFGLFKIIGSYSCFKKNKILLSGYYSCYLICILLTGIQGDSLIYFILAQFIAINLMRYSLGYRKFDLQSEVKLGRPK